MPGNLAGRQLTSLLEFAWAPRFKIQRFSPVIGSLVRSIRFWTEKASDSEVRVSQKTSLIEPGHPNISD